MIDSSDFETLRNALVRLPTKSFTAAASGLEPSLIWVRGISYEAGGTFVRPLSAGYRSLLLCHLSTRRALVQSALKSSPPNICIEGSVFWFAFFRSKIPLFLPALSASAVSEFFLRAIVGSSGRRPVLLKVSFDEKISPPIEEADPLPETTPAFSIPMWGIPALIAAILEYLFQGADCTPRLPQRPQIMVFRLRRYPWLSPNFSSWATLRSPLRWFPVSNRSRAPSPPCSGVLSGEVGFAGTGSSAHSFPSRGRVSKRLLILPLAR